MTSEHRSDKIQRIVQSQRCAFLKKALCFFEKAR